MNNQANKYNEGKNRNDSQQETTGMFKKIFVWFEQHHGFWTAIFTGILTLFTYMLYKVADATNETNRVTQRAFMTSLGPNITKVPSAEGKNIKGYNVWFLMTNNGTTPAKDGTMQSNFYFGESSPDTITDFRTMPQSQIQTFAIGPKVGIQMTPIFISAEQMEEAAQKRKHLVFWGWAHYHDVFSRTPWRLTEYCIDATDMSWTKPEHTDLATDFVMQTPSCKVHFCFDEGCEDCAQQTK